MNGPYDARSGIAALIQQQQPPPALARQQPLRGYQPPQQTQASDPSKMAQAFKQGQDARQVLNRWTKGGQEGATPSQEVYGPPTPSSPDGLPPGTDPSAAFRGIDAALPEGEIGSINAATSGLADVGAGAADAAGAGIADAAAGAGAAAEGIGAGIGGIGEGMAGAAEGIASGFSAIAESAPWLLALLALAGGGRADPAPHLRNIGAGVRGGRSHFSRPGGGLFKGPVKGATPGRADAKGFNVARGSYVVPADVVSSLGQGNTDAGHKVLHGALQGRPVTGFAGGGQVPETVPVRLSDGEFVFGPDEVEAIGGAEKLDAMVHHVRAHTAASMRKMPPPR